MPGPLVEVDTLTAGVNLEVGRILRLGDDAELEFLRPKQGEPDGFEVLGKVIENFNRITDDESIVGDGKQVVYQVATLDPEIQSLFLTKQLHIRCQGVIYQVSQIPNVAPSEAQVFTIYCKERLLKSTFLNS